MRALRAPDRVAAATRRGRSTSLGVVGESLLYEAVERGVPLLEIVTTFTDGVDYAKATADFNSLGEDIHLHTSDWYGDPKMRSGSATAEALYRLFGWKVHRVPLVLVDEGTGEPRETEFFCWEDVVPRSKIPVALKGVLKTIGYGQPGADDQGQWYEPEYE